MVLAALVFITLSTAAPVSVPSPAITALESASPVPGATTPATPNPDESPYVVPTSEAVPAPTGLPGNFSLPSSWISRAVPAFMPRSMLALWTYARQPHDNISVMRIDNFPGSIADYAKGADAGLAAMHASIVREGGNPKCPAGTSDVVEHNDVFNEMHMAIVQDAVLEGHTIYLATYTRLQSEPVDPAVLAALGTFCPPTPAN